MESRPLPTKYCERLFTDGQKHLEELVLEIEEAKQSIDLENYLFHNEALGQRGAGKLAEAAERGGKVRIMVDGAGRPLWSSNIARLLECGVARTNAFHPFLWVLWGWRPPLIKLSFLIKLL